MPPKKKVAAAEIADNARAATLKKFITAANRKEAGSIQTFTGDALDVPSIPTGALSLDYALGVGGIPRGRLTEIYGPESAGKTSLALSVAAEAIKAGGMAAIVDVEHAITPSHVVGMGVDPDYLAISQPNSGEDAFKVIEDMLLGDLFDVIILDSVAMMTPQVELDGEMTDMQVGAQARMMAKGLRKLTGIIGDSKAAVIFINQLRMKIGQMYGNPEDTPGGKALKYAASVRLEVRSPPSQNIKDPKDATKQIGLNTTVTVKKNKVAPPQKKAEYRLIWGKGIDFAASVFQVAKDLGVLVMDGGNACTVAGTNEKITDDAGATLRGAAKIQERLSEDKELSGRIAALCMEAMAGNAAPAGANPIPDSDFDAEALEALAEGA